MSYSQNRRAPLLPPSCTLSTGVTFFNTVSLSFILGLSSFNLHHFIIGVACSGVQRFSPKYSSLRVNLGIHLQSRLHHQVSHSALGPCYQNVYFSFYIQPTCGAQAHMMLTTTSSNPSSIVITGSLFLLTLIRSSFSSLDSRPTIQTPFHSCSFVPLWSNLQPPQLFRYVSLPSSLLHTQQTNISRFHHIRQAPSFSRHRPNIQTAHSHAVTVHIPHKNDIYGDYIIIFSLKTKIEKKMIFIYLPGRLWIRSEPGQPDCLLRP